VAVVKVVENAVSDADAMTLVENLPAVITPTIEGREHLLLECAESVRQQTVACSHHVYLDTDRVGPAIIRNTIMVRLSCEYVAFVDDDDLIDPDHIETLLAPMLMFEGCYHPDLVFSWYRAKGAPETERVYEFNDYAYGVMLGGRNLIPVTVVARREAVLEAGGFWPEDRYEDYSLWMRMLERGSTFAVVPRETWTYRMLGGNRTHLPA